MARGCDACIVLSHPSFARMGHPEPGNRRLILISQFSLRAAAAAMPYYPYLRGLHLQSPDDLLLEA